MKQNRIDNVLNRRNGADLLLVSDPMAVYYLTGRLIQPGERFLGLLLQDGKKPVLFLNRLFPMEGSEDLDVVFYSDGDDIPSLLQRYIDSDLILGVDKTLQARFLLDMIDRGIAKRFVNGSLAVDLTRAIKDEEELETMRKASLINDEAMAVFKTLVKEGISEEEVARQIPDIYGSLGAQGCSFEPIVAFGVNAADPHHVPDDTKLKKGDAVLFDVGCVYRSYCSDMTRTFFFREGPSDRQRQVYELVKKANEKAEAFVKEGALLCDIDKTARDVIAEGGYGEYFTHRLGHFIGIECHEYGDVSASFKIPARKGNVFSIEPGIYDPKTLGCRIEDLVIVTEDGCEVLNHYPHDIEII